MNSDGLTAVDSTDVRETPRPDPVKHLPGLEHQAGADWDLYDAAFLAIGAVGFCLGLLA